MSKSMTLTQELEKRVNLTMAAIRIAGATGERIAEEWGFWRRVIEWRQGGSRWIPSLEHRTIFIRSKIKTALEKESADAIKAAFCRTNWKVIQAD